LGAFLQSDISKSEIFSILISAELVVL